MTSGLVMTVMMVGNLAWAGPMTQRPQLEVLDDSGPRREHREARREARRVRREARTPWLLEETMDGRHVGIGVQVLPHAVSVEARYQLAAEVGLSVGGRAYRLDMRLCDILGNCTSAAARGGEVFVGFRGDHRLAPFGDLGLGVAAWSDQSNFCEFIIFDCGSSYEQGVGLAASADGGLSLLVSVVEVDLGFRLTRVGTVFIPSPRAMVGLSF